MSVLYRAPSGRHFTTTDEIDKEYDLVAAEPSFPTYVEQFVSRSVQARHELDNEIGVPYGPSLAETLDVFPGEPGGPIVIFIHGGYWMMLSSTEHSYVAPGLVANGATVVIPNYALCPEVTIDEIVRQIRASVVWAYQNGEKYGADSNNIVITGHSAGGHLAACTLGTDWSSWGVPQSAISGACGISGIYDLRPFVHTNMQPSLQFTGDQILRNSPILDIPLTMPKFLLSVGGQQSRELHRQSLDYLNACRAVDLDVELRIQEDKNHFDETLQFLDKDSELTRWVMELTRPSR